MTTVQAAEKQNIIKSTAEANAAAAGIKRPRAEPRKEEGYDVGVAAVVGYEAGEEERLKKRKGGRPAKVREGATAAVNCICNQNICE